MTGKKQVKNCYRIRVAARLVTCSLLALTALNSYADGPGAYRDRLRATETSEETRVRDIYDAGVALTDKAANEASATSSYELALAKFQEAVKLEPSFYEAHTYVGYANRKLGRHERALEAYAIALRLKPDYVPAIEYQGEAFLGLDRFDEARFNYLRLYATSPTQADKLLDAMQAWSAARRQEPRRIPPAELAEIEAWISQRIAARLVTGERSHTGWTTPTSR